jgi:hypothetical protein
MPGSQHVLTCFHGGQGVLLNCNSRWCVSDPLPPSAALPLTEGENKSNLPFVTGSLTHHLEFVATIARTAVARHSPALTVLEKHPRES